MSRSLVLFAVLILLANVVQAEGPRPRLMGGADRILSGGVVGTRKAAGDTVLLMGPWGSGAPYNGQFETPGGEADWNGWTHEDLTASLETAWHVDDYNAAFLNGHPVGNLAAYCGDPGFPACTSADTLGGYGNDYNDILEWVGTVADPAQGCRVEFDAWVNFDLEENYDYLSLRLMAENGGFVELASLTGKGANFNLQGGFDLLPNSYMGAGQNEVHLRLVVVTDNAYADWDCLFFSKGACQIDDITVSLDNGGGVSFSDFESGTLGDWSPVPWLGVGDFTQLRNNLEDIDPCQTNYSWQVCFIDDGLVVPGTGGTGCINWCYGPNGYILNNSGGLAGSGYYLRNQAVSPAIPWPAGGYEGGRLDLDVYLHMELDVDDPGIFAIFDVRSTNTGNPDDLPHANWTGFSFFYYGQGYERLGGAIGSFLEDDVTHIQVRVGAQELGYLWGWMADDGTPAPYFDNVRLTAYEYHGPQIFAYPWSLAQDAFPAGGVLDLENLGANSVPFDMAGNIWTGEPPGIDHGDSITCFVEPMGGDASLMEPPRLYYELQANPLFNPYRTAGLPPTGFVEGDSVRVNGSAVVGQFAFDLPDEGFLFPGDQLHYFIKASQWDPELGLTTALLPADTTGFSNFETIVSYDPVYSFRALPSLGGGEGYGIRNAVDILVWDDSGRTPQVALWQEAMAYCNQWKVAEFDYFYANSTNPDDGIGLGSAASIAQLAGYDFILYNSGDYGSRPLGNGEEVGGLSPDIQQLTSWLELGDKGLLLSGDNICSGLNLSAAGQVFLDTWVRVSVDGMDVRPFISGQITPGVVGTSGSSFSDLTWVANGGCPDIKTFDAVTTLTGAERLAEFQAPGGGDGLYPYAAATGHVETIHGARVASLPFALESIVDVPDKQVSSVPVREEVLNRFLDYLQVSPKYWLDVPAVGELSVTGYPNPFNPVMRIDLYLPTRGQVQLKIYNLKGQLVRNLLDEQREAGTHQVTWDGTDDGGRQAASGVYFYEVSSAGKSVLGKVTMIK